MFILYPQAALFPLGQLFATPGVLVEVTEVEISLALARHAMADWGDLDQEDIDENNRALKEGSRLLSAYHSSSRVKFWIITEWDRSVTTVLLPSEY
ncbi:hypothetical protein [Brevifollis gellanilyticus]|uniref:Plasmid related protein n=1 Tax=Brevifollis gellanilyticus TaxID=748831 RepID=A0A512MCH4_9BACT|nr:hypothetical protein [Brevifollis gellanilyticus]GEP44444.1 hypothetical protein BGE01nite_37350 [Brevifollis gellanilyticus]